MLRFVIGGILAQLRRLTIAVSSQPFHIYANTSTRASNYIGSSINVRRCHILIYYE